MEEVQGILKKVRFDGHEDDAPKAEKASPVVLAFGTAPTQHLLFDEFDDEEEEEDQEEEEESVSISKSADMRRELMAAEEVSVVETSPSPAAAAPTPSSSPKRNKKKKDKGKDSTSISLLLQSQKALPKQSVTNACATAHDQEEEEAKLTRLGSYALATILCVAIFFSFFDNGILYYYRGGNGINGLLQSRGYDGMSRTDGLKFAREHVQHHHLLRNVTQDMQWQSRTGGAGSKSTILMKILSPKENLVLDKGVAQLEVVIAGAALTPNFYNTRTSETTVSKVQAQLDVRLNGLTLKIGNGELFDVPLESPLNIKLDLVEYRIKDGVHLLEVGFTLLSGCHLDGGNGKNITVNSAVGFYYHGLKKPLAIDKNPALSEAALAAQPTAETSEIGASGQPAAPIEPTGGTTDTLSVAGTALSVKLLSVQAPGSNGAIKVFVEQLPRSLTAQEKATRSAINVNVDGTMASSPVAVVDTATADLVGGGGPAEGNIPPHMEGLAIINVEAASHHTAKPGFFEIVINAVVFVDMAESHTAIIDLIFNGEAFDITGQVKNQLASPEAKKLIIQEKACLLFFVIIGGKIEGQDHTVQLSLFDGMRANSFKTELVKWADKHA